MLIMVNRVTKGDEDGEDGGEDYEDDGGEEGGEYEEVWAYLDISKRVHLGFLDVVFDILDLWDMR